MRLEHNPDCPCHTTPKVSEQYEDWTQRSAETKARFGLEPVSDHTKRRPRCWKCERPDAVPHEWHDDGTIGTKET